jgi:hypothetical protein
MIAFERPSAASNGRGDSELDGLLRGFFRAEMPHPWPAYLASTSVKVPALPPQERTQGSSWLVKGRFVLATAIALFLVAQFLLPNPFNVVHRSAPPPSDISMDPGANTKVEKDVLDQESGMEIDGDIIRVNVTPGDK